MTSTPVEVAGSDQGVGLTTEDVPEEVARRRGVTVFRPPLDPARMRGYTESALAGAAAGRLRPVIGQRFPLERAADAHAALQSRATVGKALLELA